MLDITIQVWGLVVALQSRTVGYLGKRSSTWEPPPEKDMRPQHKDGLKINGRTNYGKEEAMTLSYLFLQ